MLFRGEVEVDRREISKERDDGGGSLQGCADHLERTFGCVLDDLQEPAAREFVAVVETERVGLHVQLRNSSFPAEFQPARASGRMAVQAPGPGPSHEMSRPTEGLLNMGEMRVARNRESGQCLIIGR